MFYGGAFCVVGCIVGKCCPEGSTVARKEKLFLVGYGGKELGLKERKKMKKEGVDMKEWWVLGRSRSEKLDQVKSKR